MYSPVARALPVFAAVDDGLSLNQAAARAEVLPRLARRMIRTRARVRRKMADPRNTPTTRHTGAIDFIAFDEVAPYRCPECRAMVNVSPCPLCVARAGEFRRVAPG